MKIIGKTNLGFIVEARDAEVLHLLGRDWHQGRDLRLDVGSEIQVAEMFDRLDALRRVEDKLKDASKTLHALGDLLDAQLPSVVAAAQPEPANPETAPAGKGG